MPQYERGHSGQEVGEMQQRLVDLGYEVSVTNEFDEHTEEALKRYQVDWLYSDGSGVADEETLTQLEYHHSSHTSQSSSVEVRYSEHQYSEQPANPPVSEDGQHWWDGENWIPFQNPQVTLGYGETTDKNGEHVFVGFGEVTDPVTGSKITSLGGHLDVSDTGIHGDVAGGKFDLQTPSGVGVQAGGFTASAEAVWDNQGYYGLGAQAAVAEGGLSYGQQGDAASADDVFLKGGVSEGAGMAGRVYGGTDVDGDGVREYGLGVDYGPGSGDLRIESETLTEAQKAAGEAYDSAAQTAGEYYDSAAQTASETYDAAAETISNIVSGEEPMPDVRN